MLIRITLLAEKCFSSRSEYLCNEKNLTEWMDENEWMNGFDLEILDLLRFSIRPCNHTALARHSRQPKCFDLRTRINE